MSRRTPSAPSTSATVWSKKTFARPPSAASISGHEDLMAAVLPFSPGPAAHPAREWPMQCPACGESNFDFAKSCQCGHRFTPSADEGSRPEPPPLPAQDVAATTDGLQLETAEFEQASLG